MANKENKIYTESLHLFIAVQRHKDGEEKNRCLRTVIKDNHDIDTNLAIFESKLKIMGGTWRIYKTVNARDIEKARKILLKTLIDYPEKGAFVDSQWRTSLLQRECAVTNWFMLDVDTQDEEKIEFIKKLIDEATNNQKFNYILQIIKSPSGYHIITLPFDTREILKLDYVTLLRDGYHYVKMVEK